jgi:hypothetical protein
MSRLTYFLDNLLTDGGEVAPAAFKRPGRFLILISVRGRVDPRAVVRLEELGGLKIQRPYRESNPRPSGL